VFFTAVNHVLAIKYAKGVDLILDI
jgi:hypothetical protein